MKYHYELGGCKQKMPAECVDGGKTPTDVNTCEVAGTACPQGTYARSAVWKEEEENGDIVLKCHDVEPCKPCTKLMGTRCVNNCSYPQKPAEDDNCRIEQRLYNW